MRARSSCLAALALAIPFAAAPPARTAPAPLAVVVADEDARIDELEKDLRDFSRWAEKKRQAAVKKLADIGSARAWELVIGALKDPSSQVADEAELQIARISEPKLVQRMLGKEGLESRDEWVARRVGEALGRMETPPDVAILAREAASARDADLARMLLWSIERLALSDRVVGDRAKLAAAIEPLVRKSWPGPNRAGALFALRALSGAAADAEVLAALGDREPAVRVAGLTLLDPVDGARLAEAVRASAGGSVPVRLAAIDAFARAGSRAGALALVALLEQEREERVRWIAVDALRRLSGRKDRLDHRPWQAWAESLPADWAPGVASADAAERARDGEETTVAFAGLPILSQRVAFLIDFSGSMWQERSSERTRKQAVDEALAETLAALPPEAEFNLIPYTGEPHPWSEALVPATPANVKRARAWFEAADQHGAGNFWDAALLAMSDPRVDTIVALTDGEPTGGHRWNLGLMAELFAEINRTRRVVLDVILVDAGTKKKLRDQWQRMASGSGGQLVTVEL